MSYFERKVQYCAEIKNHFHYSETIQKMKEKIKRLTELNM